MATPTAAAGILDPVLAIVSPILGLLSSPGALLLFGPLIVLVVLACPTCALFSFVAGLIQSVFIDLAPLSAVAGTVTATADANVATASALASDLPLSSSTPLPAAKAAPAEPAPVGEPRKAVVSAPETLVDMGTRPEQEALTDVRLHSSSCRRTPRRRRPRRLRAPTRWNPRLKGRRAKLLHLRRVRPTR